jgi:hypothetical protein
VPSAPNYKRRTGQLQANERRATSAQFAGFGIAGRVHADAERLRDIFEQIIAMTVESIKTTKARHLNRQFPRAAARSSSFVTRRSSLEAQSSSIVVRSSSFVL